MGKTAQSNWLPRDRHVSVWVGDRCWLERVSVPRGFLQRGFGLMGRRKVPASWGQGLFFPHCRSLHTLFMRFDLQMVFLDAEGVVVDVREAVRPWRSVTGPRAAKHVLECVGQAALLPQVGEKFTLRSLTDSAGTHV